MKYNFFPIFWNGEHNNAGPKKSWTKDDVSSIFNSTLSRSSHFIPFTIDHPTNDLPIIGWTDKNNIRLVERDNKRIIEAMPVEFSVSSLEDVKSSGRKKVSVALRSDDFSIRHIGLVKNPAVLGLPAIPFSVDSESDVILFELEGATISLTEPDTTVNQIPHGDNIMFTKTEFEALSADKIKLEQQIKTLELENRKAIADKKALEFSAFLSSDELKSKVVPALFPFALEFMKILDENSSVTFSDNGVQLTLSHLDLFKRFLTKLPDQITFKKVAVDGSDSSVAIDDIVADFNKKTKF